MENTPLRGNPTSMNFLGRVENQIKADGYQGLVTSVQLPPYLMAAAGGRIYTISTANGTAKAPVATVGTTTAAFALWNGNAATTKYCIVPLFITAFNYSGTSGVGATAMIAATTAAQGSAVSAYSGVIGPTSTSGSTARASAAVLGGAITLAGTPCWNQFGGSEAALAAGGSILCDVRGIYLIRPQWALGLTVQSTAGTTPLWGWSITYMELEIDAD